MQNLYFYSRIFSILFEFEMMLMLHMHILCMYRNPSLNIITYVIT